MIIHQELALIPYMTIGENMYLGNERGRSFSINWNETYGEADKYLKIVGLEESSRTLIKDIGVGKQQLVEIAKALAKNAKLLILDEPTVGLDPKQIIEIRELIRTLAKNHTVILSSHILAEVREVCDYVMIIAKGKLVASDTPENLENLMSGTGHVELEAKTSMEKAKAILKGIPLISKAEYREETKESVTVRIESEGSQTSGSNYSLRSRRKGFRF
mgnify:CR=1 FL=1